jgi:hypothetical protein
MASLEKIRPGLKSLPSPGIIPAFGTFIFRRVVKLLSVSKLEKHTPISVVQANAVHWARHGHAALRRMAGRDSQIGRQAAATSTWWRTQSMSNASQQQNSLLTGKLTGKNAKLCVARQEGSSPNAAFMGFSAVFPVKIIRECFSQNRETLTR